MIKTRLRIQEAADYLGVSSKTLRRWDKSEKLIPSRTTGGQRYYKRSQLDQFRIEKEREKVKKELLTKPETGLPIPDFSSSSYQKTAGKLLNEAEFAKKLKSVQKKADKIII